MNAQAIRFKLFIRADYALGRHTERRTKMPKKIPLSIMLSLMLIGAGYLVGNAQAEKSYSTLHPQQAGTSSIISSSLPKTAEEKKILDVLEYMYRNQRRGMMNVSPEDGRLLRLMTEVTNAQHVVEIGTSNGYSAIWFCLALSTTGGKLTTHEIDAGRAALARENFKRAGVDHMVTLVEGDAHEEVTKLKGPIDMVFLDADKPGYLDYLNKLLPLVRPGGLVIAHNMRYPSPDPRYIKAITTNPDLETIFLHMNAAGIGVSLKKR